MNTPGEPVINEQEGFSARPIQQEGCHGFWRPCQWVFAGQRRVPSFFSFGAGPGAPGARKRTLPWSGFAACCPWQGARGGI